jgi:hypothetical protein
MEARKEREGDSMEKWTEWRTIYVVWKNGEDRLVDSM